jgi:hypothetical protein
LLVLLLAAVEHLLEEAELGADRPDQGEEEEWKRCEEAHCGGRIDGVL